MSEDKQKTDACAECGNTIDLKKDFYLKNMKSGVILCTKPTCGMNREVKDKYTV